mgnify:CR=1 FL=1
MSTNDGGPAFPALTMLCGSDTVVASCHNSAQPGMSLRDWFAGQAIIALYQTDRSEYPTSKDAEQAYRIADAMLAARKAEGGVA